MLLRLRHTMDGLKTHFLEASNTTFVEEKSGCPVVFIHGAVADYQMWDAVRKSISQEYRFIGLNLHYHGTTPWITDTPPYSALNHAAQVVRFLYEIKTEPIHLVGNSYGAQIALRVALIVPELLRSLVLHEPSGDALVGGPDATAIIAQKNLLFALAVDAVNKCKLDMAVQLFITAVMNRGPGRWNAFPEQARTLMLDNARTLPLLFSAPPAPRISCEQLGQLKLPTLIISGAETIPYFSHIGKWVADCIPKARREVISNTTHDSQNEDLVTYNRVLLDFLREQA